MLVLASVLYAQNDVFPLKLRVATYNIGHFNQGELGGYQNQNPVAHVKRWQQWISEQSVDIFAFQEWNRMFDKEAKLNAQKELLQPFYNNVYCGIENKWIFNILATNYKLTNIREKKWLGDYYAIIGDMHIGGKVITIMSTHIPWQKEWHEEALNMLMQELKKYPYFICMGDINALNVEQLRFQEEGFNIANGGHQGWFSTGTTGRIMGKLDTNIDNIITSKNIKIFNVSSPETGLNDQDHLPVIVDVVITN